MKTNQSNKKTTTPSNKEIVGIFQAIKKFQKKMKSIDYD
jgi:hypothetical protein